jgi:hypothetical protein
MIMHEGALGINRATTRCSGTTRGGTNGDPSTSLAQYDDAHAYAYARAEGVDHLLDIMLYFENVCLCMQRPTCVPKHCNSLPGLLAAFTAQVAVQSTQLGYAQARKAGPMPYCGAAAWQREP